MFLPRSIVRAACSTLRHADRSWEALLTSSAAFLETPLPSSRDLGSFLISRQLQVAGRRFNHSLPSKRRRLQPLTSNSR